MSLRELAWQGIIEGDARVGRASYAHGLVDIGPARKRVPDGAAQAGGCPAKRLDLGGVIMRLVFEHNQPGLFDSVYIGFYDYGAGIDLLGLVQVIQFSLSF